MSAPTSTLVWPLKKKKEKTLCLRPRSYFFFYLVFQHGRTSVATGKKEKRKKSMFAPTYILVFSLKDKVGKKRRKNNGNEKFETAPIMHLHDVCQVRE